MNSAAWNLRTESPCACMHACQSFSLIQMYTGISGLEGMCKLPESVTPHQQYHRVETQQQNPTLFASAVERQFGIIGL